VGVRDVTVNPPVGTRMNSVLTSAGVAPPSPLTVIVNTMESH
jgi:hypothetical protein